MQRLDCAARYDEIHRAITGKRGLRSFYGDVYREYRDCLRRSPHNGIVLEIGSGAGFVKECIPEAVTSDILPYHGIDRVIDATALPYADRSLRMICMTNVFHHLPDAAAFLREAGRCLVPGGRILIADQHVGIFSRFILKYLHHEPFDPQAVEWRFESQGPLSGANGALAWIVFVRDREKLRTLFPELRLVRYQPHSPLKYWLTGGLKKWSLLPGFLVPLAGMFDNLLMAVSPAFGSFVYVEMVKTETSAPERVMT